MIRSLLIKLIVIVFSIGALHSCSSEKGLTERQGLMMPKTSEIPRNKGKYIEVDYKKRDKAITKRLNQSGKKKRKYKNRY